MTNHHTRNWAYDRKRRKYVFIKNISLYSLFIGKYDLEPNGFPSYDELFEAVRKFNDRA